MDVRSEPRMVNACRSLRHTPSWSSTSRGARGSIAAVEQLLNEDPANLDADAEQCAEEVGGEDRALEGMGVYDETRLHDEEGSDVHVDEDEEGLAVRYLFV